MTAGVRGSSPGRKQHDGAQGDTMTAVALHFLEVS
jgi:hypothetical protein